MLKTCYAASMLVAFCSIALAQSPATQQDEPPAVQQESGTGTAQGLEPMESARLSMIDGILDNTATHLGFGFSSYEMYTTDAVQGAPNQRFTATMLNPRMFANFRSKGSQFHLDYTAGYSIYKQHSGFNTITHSGTVTWGLRLARSTNFSLSDTVSSIPNDYGFILGQPGQLSLLSQIQIQPIYTQAVLVEHQRLVTNSLTATVSQRVAKNTRVALFGSYDYLQYGKASFKDTQGFQLGVQLQYQFKKWLFLDSSYSTYLNSVNRALQSSNVHRLQVGGFRFQISRAIQLFTAGTVEYSHYLGTGYTVAGAAAGLSSRVSKSNSILLSYHHGLSTVFGPGTILNGDDVTLAFRQRLSSRLTLLMDAALIQGRGFLPGATMRSGSGNGGIQISMQRNLFATMNVGYALQHFSDPSFSAPSVRQYTAYVGLSYFMPALRGR
jgi:hypothetical protein